MYDFLKIQPPEYDSRVKAMELDEKPTEDYNDIGELDLTNKVIILTGGCDKQITELREAIVKPITHKHLFTALGIKAPKGFLSLQTFILPSFEGVLLFGPPGTGKTLMARACAARTNACFLKLSATQLVQVGKPLCGELFCSFKFRCILGMEQKWFAMLSRLHVKRLLLSFLYRLTYFLFLSMLSDRRIRCNWYKTI